MNRLARGATIPSAISVEQKRRALDVVLASRTFARTDQLRRFLQFVCECELSGRSSEITEYTIGIECLGKTEGYSTSEDSSVRTRAHTLRQKLEEYYEGEGSAAPVRIALPKGSYVPSWTEKAPLPSEDRKPTSRRTLFLPAVASFVAGLIVAAGAYYLYSRLSARPESILAEAWGPLARPDADVLMCFETNPYLAVLPFGPGPLPPSLLKLDPPPEVYDWFKQYYTLGPDERLYTHEVNSSMPFGRTLAALAVVEALHRLRVPYQAIPQAVTSITAIRRRNTMWFGNVQFSPIIARLLDDAPLTVRYEPSVHDMVISSPTGTGKAFYPKRGGPDNSVVRAFGLLTVMPSVGSTDGEHRTVIFSGTNSAGVQAAAELFSTPARLLELRQQFGKQGHAGYPGAYQVVVSCKTDNVRLLEFAIVQADGFNSSRTSTDQRR